MNKSCGIKVKQQVKNAEEKFALDRVHSGMCR